MNINNLDGIIFDLDGTIYLGEQALPGAVALISELRRRNKRVLFVSNKPLQPGEAYARKLSLMGIPAGKEDVITSGAVLGAYLSKNAPEMRLYVLGEESLCSELRSQGLKLVDSFDEHDASQVIETNGIDAVVVSFDRTLNYRKLNIAYQALVRGARFLATNADKVCPMPDGAIPDAGAIIASLEHITGRKLDLLAGKPSKIIMDFAVDKMGVCAQRCLMVGDRLETDIRMGNEAGMMTGLVLTGVTERAHLPEARYQPDFVWEGLTDLLEWVSK
jgi:arabinose operon protein AraL